MQNICRILQLTDISIMAVERDKSRRECMLLRMSTRDSVPLRLLTLLRSAYNTSFSEISVKRTWDEYSLHFGTTLYDTTKQGLKWHGTTRPDLEYVDKVWKARFEMGQYDMLCDTNTWSNLKGDEMAYVLTHIAMQDSYSTKQDSVSCCGVEWHSITSCKIVILTWMTLK